MAAHTYKFKVGEDWETGTIGLVSEGSMGSYDAEPAVSGLLIAHDILEHNFKGDDGSAHFEWQAMGFMLHGRIQGGYWGNFVDYPRYKNTNEILAEVFYSIHSFTAQRDNVYLMRPPRAMHTHHKTTDYEINYDMEQIREYLADVLDKFEDEYQTNFEDEYRISKSEYINRAEYWIRTGYRKAVRKYERRHGLRPFLVANLFYEVERVGDKLCKWYASEEHIGKEIHIHVDIKTAEVTFDDEIFDPYDYY